MATEPAFKFAGHSREAVEQAYKIGKELGSGNFAVVRVAIKRDTLEKMAIKIIDKKLCSGKEDMIQTELAVLHRVKHPHIVAMYEVFDTPDKLYLILQYVGGGELFDRIVDDGNFTERKASVITKQIADALKYLHDMGIVHRDLKPENLLFKQQGSTDHIMVTDFGLAKIIDDGTELKTACGTPNYVAPEILMQKKYGVLVDIWSLGVITFILLSGYPPFYDENDAKLYELIMKGKFDFDERYWSEISKPAKNLIKNMLTVDPGKRYDAAQVLAHPWITGVADVPQVNLSKSVSLNLSKTVLADKQQQHAAAAAATHGTLPEEATTLV